MKICCGGFHLGENLRLNGATLGVGSAHMELTDAGLEVNTGAQGETMSVGCVEDANGDLVNGVRGTDDVHIYAGNDKEVIVGNDLVIDGEIVGDKSIVLASSTEGSSKQYRITVNDSGVITATEIQ